MPTAKSAKRKPVAKATTVKRSTVTKKAPAKVKTVAKKAPAKRTSTKVLRKKAPEMRSFRLSPEDRKFLEVGFTRQTVYWLILSGVILSFGLWIINLNDRVQQIYDQVDSSVQLQSDLSTIKE